MVAEIIKKKSFYKDQKSYNNKLYYYISYDLYKNDFEISFNFKILSFFVTI